MGTGKKKEQLYPKEVQEVVNRIGDQPHALALVLAAESEENLEDIHKELRPNIQFHRDDVFAFKRAWLSLRERLLTQSAGRVTRNPKAVARMIEELYDEHARRGTMMQYYSKSLCHALKPSAGIGAINRSDIAHRMYHFVDLPKKTQFVFWTSIVEGLQVQANLFFVRPNKQAREYADRVVAEFIVNEVDLTEPFTHRIRTIMKSAVISVERFFDYRGSGKVHLFVVLDVPLKSVLKLPIRRSHGSQDEVETEELFGNLQQNDDIRTTPEFLEEVRIALAKLSIEVTPFEAKPR